MIKTNPEQKTLAFHTTKLITPLVIVYHHSSIHQSDAPFIKTIEHRFFNSSKESALAKRDRDASTCKKRNNTGKKSSSARFVLFFTDRKRKESGERGIR
ncbi:hypothetical protein [Desulfoluna limicola]|uniref:hypothetical protein n=1 Tax=Desulfoluna limicola TaxID=2810562 RepID=UPI001F1F882E|nr:hypothetical protein [Desulfoluna limicola]